MNTQKQSKLIHNTNSEKNSNDSEMSIDANGPEKTTKADMKERMKRLSVKKKSTKFSLLNINDIPGLENRKVELMGLHMKGKNKLSLPAVKEETNSDSVSEQSKELSSHS